MSAGCGGWRGVSVLAIAAAMIVFGSVPSRQTASGAGGLSADVITQVPPHAWPMFGGTVFRNMVNPRPMKLPGSWNVKEGERKNVKWVAALGSVAYGGPVISGGKIFIGTNNEKPKDPQIKGDKGILLCLRESDGQFLWQAVHDKLESGMENDWEHQGVASTPAVDGNRVYYVSNRCELICADTEGLLDGKNDGVQDEKYTGKTAADIVWRLDMMKELKVYPHFVANCSPLVAGDLVFVVTGNGVDGENKLPAPEAPSFIAVNKNTGKVVWQSAAPGKNILDGQWASPAYAIVNGTEQVIFPGGDGWLYGFEAKTGKPIWKFDCNPKKSEYRAGGRGTRNYLVATPVVYDNKVYVGVGQNPEHAAGVGHLWCVDITKTGDLSPVDDNFDPKADINKNSGLVWHYGGKLAKADSGRETVFGRTMSNCAIHDGLVFAAELDGYIHCLDAKTGQKYWDHDLKAEIWGSPYWVDGKVYLGTNDSDVHVFAGIKEKKYLGKVEMDTPIKSTAVAVDGVLYVMTDTHLYAIMSK
jgi:outer membrane protein assembly factor BamB